MRNYLNSLLAVMLGGTLLVGCDNGSQQNQKQASAKTDGGDEEGGGEEGGGEEGGSGSDSAAGDFDGWCEKAGEVAVVDKQLSALYDKMCSGGNATELMTDVMITKAYKGSGSPKLTEIEPIEGDKTYSTAFFAVGIKLPIDIETHFTKVGPKAGDAAAQIKLAEANGASAEFEVLEDFKKDGKYHVRGWKVRSKQTKTVTIVKVVTESVSRSDQFELEKGSLYLYTQYVIEGVEGVKDFSLLTAGIKTEKGSYLLTTAKVKVNNKGLPDIAKGQITDTAKELIKSMYKAAAEAK
jgi:hypothetical protein